MFCPNCGKQTGDGSVFCEECGANISAPAANAQENGANVQENGANVQENGANAQENGENTQPPITPIIPQADNSGYAPPVYPSQQSGYTQPPPTGYPYSQVPQAAGQALPVRKSKAGLIIALSSIFVVIIVAFFVVVNVLGLFGFASSSSIVSGGVDKSDLSNITLGQFVFKYGETTFYSGCEDNGAPHIYKIVGSGAAQPIFDGFGWSLTVRDNWLYFSGSENSVLDYKYYLYRISFDGKKKEKIGEDNAFGLNVYKNLLFYVKFSDFQNERVTDGTVWRKTVDGKDDKQIYSQYGGGLLIYKDIMYYMTNGTIYKSKTDGSDKQTVYGSDANSYVLGGGKFYINKSDGSVVSADLDGKNIKMLISSGVACINKYKSDLFYITYDSNSYSTASGTYTYNIHRFNLDSSSDIIVYTGNSRYFYFNVLDEKIFVLNHYFSNELSKYNIEVNYMNLDGSNIINLDK